MLCYIQAKGVQNEYPDWALAMAALLAVSSLVPVVGGGLVYLVRRILYGSAGVQERCQYEANLEKKFCRTETSASMKPMLGPVRLSLCTFLSLTGLVQSNCKSKGIRLSPK